MTESRRKFHLGSQMKVMLDKLLKNLEFELQAKKARYAGCWEQVSNFLEDLKQ
jgi:hypothetical protein